MAEGRCSTKCTVKFKGINLEGSYIMEICTQKNDCNMNCKNSTEYGHSIADYLTTNPSLIIDPYPNKQWISYSHIVRNGKGGALQARNGCRKQKGAAKWLEPHAVECIASIHSSASQVQSA